MKRNAYIDFLNKYLQSNPDALLWALSYGLYVHSIDDIIDGDKNDSEFILKTFEYALIVYAYPFFVQHIQMLYPLCKMASNTYMDSVLMERSSNKWDKNYADVLRQMGNEVILAVIEIVCGLNVRRHASIELREISYKMHHDQLGNPV